jgi:diketogulonate reductase-like aldo/keto reductase
MKGKKLYNGEIIPLIGLGGLKKDIVENIEEIVYYSIKDGIRLIESDPNLKNEEEIGKGIKKALDEKLVKREELFIIGKLWITNKSDPEKALKKTLKKLHIDYLNLYLDQWPTIINHGNKKDIETVSIYDLWPKMENLIKENLTKSIGVSNYNIQALNNLLSFCKIRPVVNGIEFHPYCYQKNMITLCEKMNITLLAYYPLAKNYQEDLFIDEKTNNQINNIINKLERKYKKTSTQIILNWHKHLGTIPIVSTSLINATEENLEALEFGLGEEEINNLGSLDKKIIINDNRQIFGYNIMA